MVESRTRIEAQKDAEIDLQSLIVVLREPRDEYNQDDSRVEFWGLRLDTLNIQEFALQRYRQ